MSSNNNRFTEAQKQSKLENLYELEGLTEDDVMHMAFSSVVTGICLQPGCNYTTDVEPDCRAGYCEICHTRSVESAPSLMGVI